MKCNRTLGFSLVLVIGWMLGGCVPGTESYTLKPDNLQKNGLVVGEVTFIYKDFKHRYTNFGVKLAFDNEKLPAITENGHFFYDLPPGTHTLKSLSTVGGRTIRSYPLNRTFSVTSGTTTNLGNIVVLLDTTDPRRFYPYFVDNSEQMVRYISHVKPEIQAALRNKKTLLKAGPYADDKSLRQLRLAIAVRQLKYGVNINKELVHGRVGTVAHITERSNKPTIVDVLDTGTTEPAWACDKRGQMAACLIADIAGNTSMLKMDLSKRKMNTTVPGPKNFFPFALYHYGAHSFIALDRNSDVYYTNDDGATWKHYRDVRKEEEHDNDTEYGPFAYYGTDGLYLLTRNDHGTLLHLTSDKAGIKKVKSPAEDEFVFAVMETSLSLILGPQNAFIGDSDLFIRPHGSKQWTAYKIPSNQCEPLVKMDKGGMTLMARCEKGSEIYLSSDGGKSWKAKTNK